ncbi:acyl-CoA dehydrogenase family protein [Nocardia macrotermitis]|uniref:Putative acyl-CoA dehydrogenase fadE25 n=1 Tax=Nocardia macrotermitis TaxID=2585198 RepID=A0A7K0D732_9NOCA|nr:acyl-CoA dehydrogenase family protein [Nocardia macrotermitis]MQY21566.1 putative acyl-CoA dehydrogenase fadE25 [Nocardia macrotermitis]
MNFELSDEQAMLREISRDLLSERASLDLVRSGLDSALDVDPELWRLGGELGWPGLGLPEQYGGAGQGLVELALVAEEGGRALVRGPFMSSAIVGAAVAGGGRPELRARVCAELADGSCWATWAFGERNAPWTLDGIRTVARADGDGIVLDGVKTAVQDAGGARWLLVTAVHDDSPASFLVDRNSPGVTVRREQTLDPTRAFYEVRLESVRVPMDHRLGGGPEEIQRMLDYATTLCCADALGAMQRMLELTVEYTKVRVQFDRPIGSFQAVKHACTDMAMLVHGSRAATYYAAMAADAEAGDRARSACVAASYVSGAAADVADSALQLHGGIGFTWEHDLHLYIRRAKTDCVLYGDADVHRDRLCTLLQRATTSL